MSQPTSPAAPVRDGSRDGSRPRDRRPPCPVCATALPSPRARYCSAACRQRAYRLRQFPADGPDLATLRQDLQRRRALVAHTVYQCPSCEARLVGVRRCPDCQLFCRALGPGGPCPDCETPILLTELLPTEVLP
jgi:hypothetical protein